MVMNSNWDELSESLNMESEKAWHIFSLLVLIGKPIPIQNMASLCRLFTATPAFISSLCSIPNSPITLSNHLLCISSVAFSSFATYLSPSFTNPRAANCAAEENRNEVTDKIGTESTKLGIGATKGACKLVHSDHLSEAYVKKPKTNLSQDQPNLKVLPHFESYIVEEEVGSGGFGTVYRARRKNDGALVAIKCPHANAHKTYFNNELKMLERFRGRNFLIQYEGCVESENSDCFVMQYVEHDRPEVLKKEIYVFQLKCYAFCLFKALSELHKQGIAHRDVKPGNFLFSRKTNKGYLIDFNLAMEMHQNYKSIDGSGITSVKHVSGRMPSGEPLPCQGRKELISLAQEAMQTPRPGVLHVPAPTRKRDAASPGKFDRQLLHPTSTTKRVAASPRIFDRQLLHPTHTRKRVVASPGKFDRQLLHPTPLPSNSTSFALSCVGLFKNKGDGKRKREGACAGTEGFRAPEVLFGSQHQGPKIDIWSAGVTLLYLMIGKSPFFGDPEQNIKEIAKLRGCEDLWEVAKWHNRKSSFPEELYGKQSLTSMNLREWCQMNTKRQDFLQETPSSLYDLVDKCLTVNPSLRITAEDALKHELFASIHENLRKQRDPQSSFAGKQDC